MSIEQIAAIKAKRLAKKRGTIKTDDLEGGVVRTFVGNRLETLMLLKIKMCMGGVGRRRGREGGGIWEGRLFPFDLFIECRITCTWTTPLRR